MYPLSIHYYDFCCVSVCLSVSPCVTDVGVAVTDLRDRTCAKSSRAIQHSRLQNYHQDFSCLYRGDWSRLIIRSRALYVCTQGSQPSPTQLSAFHSIEVSFVF